MTKQFCMILILGGTEHARCLSNAIVANLSPQYPELQIIYSLAGVTPAPLLPETHPCLTIRQGGFGGRQALQDYLHKHNIGLVINATHAFTDIISSNAMQATQNLTVPYIRYQQDAWLESETGTQRIVTDEAHLQAEFLIHLQTHFENKSQSDMPDMPDEKFSIFLALGIRALQNLKPLFEHRYSHHCLYYLRVMRPLNTAEQQSLPQNCQVIMADLPFSQAKERALLQQHNIQIMLCRNSGSDAGRHKLRVAQDLNIPVIMLAQPAHKTAQYAMKINNDAQCLEFIKQHLR